MQSGRGTLGTNVPRLIRILAGRRSPRTTSTAAFFSFTEALELIVLALIHLVTPTVRYAVHMTMRPGIVTSTRGAPIRVIIGGVVVRRGGIAIFPVGAAAGVAADGVAAVHDTRY